jgi:hypothetical protein
LHLRLVLLAEYCASMQIAGVQEGKLLCLVPLDIRVKGLYAPIYMAAMGGRTRASRGGLQEDCEVGVDSPQGLDFVTTRKVYSTIL